MTTQRIPIPGTSLALDGQTVTTSQGAAIREVTTIGDPSIDAALAQVVNAPPCIDDYGLVTHSLISFDDTAAVDAFGRLRVSMSHTLFDAQQEYGLDTLRVWDATANGTLSNASPGTNGSVTSGSNAVGPTDANTRMTPITVSTTNGHYSILQSRQYPRYIPGKGHLVLATGIFASGANATASIVRRSSTSGTAVDVAVAQADWNIDCFCGDGPSGITLDFTKTQILFIAAQWLGVGRVIVGFDVDGKLFPAHAFLNANILTVPYTQSFNIPVRYELRNTGAAESKARVGLFDHANGIFLETVRAVAGGSIQMVCASVQSEGGEEARGFPRTFGSATAIGTITTRRPIRSIRPKATFNSRTNRAHIEEIEIELVTGGASVYWEIVLGGTLTGASFAEVSASSVAEGDVAATAITGGVTIKSGFAVAGSGAVKGATSGTGDTRNPFTLSQIDALTATQDSVSLVVTSLGGNASVNSAINWHEQTV